MRLPNCHALLATLCRWAAYWPRNFRSHRAMLPRPDPMPGLPIPRYLENVLWRGSTGNFTAGFLRTFILVVPLPTYQNILIRNN